MCSWGVLNREFTFVVADSTEVTDIGVSHHGMAPPLRWDFFRRGEVQRTWRKINELEACLESLIYLDQPKNGYELFTVYILKEQIKINSNLGVLLIFFFLCFI